MSINLTDELLAKTKKGKIASAKQVFLEGDQENLQQIGDKTHQLEDAIKDISVTGGASTATAVSYNNETSGMTAVTAQGAIDELATKNKAQDAIIENKAEKSEVDTELDKKFDKENIAQEFGDSENKVVSQFALPFREIDSPEFIKAIVDADDNVLFGFYRATGKPYYPLNDMYHVIQNKEYFAAWLDAADHILLGIKRDGEIIGEIHDVNALKQVIHQLQSDFALLQDIFPLQESPEYLAVEADADGKILSATYHDGSHYSNNLKSETIDAKVDKENGKSLIDSGVAESYSIIEDLEGRGSMETDAENKVLSYRDSDGVKYENSMKVDYFHIGKGVSEFVNDLEKQGYINKTDLSNVSEIILPIPNNVAKVNFIADSLPSSKNSNLNGTMEYFDMNGNYFKKKIKNFSLQGATSLAAPKKNYAIDLVDSTIKFGNLVTQDSFHFKANYYDIVRGKSNLAYDLWLDILRYNRPYYKTKPWLIIEYDKYSAFNGTNSFDNDFSIDARCTPYGFPVELYFNGKYIGLYTMNIKKHRDNYNMNKSSALNIMLDPDAADNLFKGTSIPWNGFEIRNPKNLKYQEKQHGVLDYDADLAQAEIMGEDSEFYDSSDKNCIRTSLVKKELKAFNEAMADIVSNPTKEKLEKVFDIDWLIDYFLWSNLILDADGVYRNTQWLMYDGVKMFPTPYDCDQIFGCQWKGNFINKKTRNPESMIMGYNSKNIPFKYLYNLYGDRIKNRYLELKEGGIYTKEYVMSLLSAYMSLIGKNTYKREFDTWNQTPCYRKPNVNDGWLFMGDYYEGDSIPLSYSPDTTYQVGQYVKYGDYYYKAASVIHGVLPIGNLYTQEPIEGGYFDSLFRMEKWLDIRLTFLDTFFNNLK